MKALVILKYGPPEVFVERDLPEPRAGEILIRVEAEGAAKAHHYPHNRKNIGQAVLTVR